MICYNISLYLYQNTNIIVMAYFRYNILISQYEYWKDQIKSHKFQIIQKFQLPNIAGNFILSIISNVLDVLSIKHFKISEIFGLWYRGVWYRDIIILNIIQRHNFFQSFASIGRVDLVYIVFNITERNKLLWCSHDVAFIPGTIITCKFRKIIPIPPMYVGSMEHHKSVDQDPFMTGLLHEGIFHVGGLIKPVIFDSLP